MIKKRSKIKKHKYKRTKKIGGSEAITHLSFEEIRKLLQTPVESSVHDATQTVAKSKKKPPPVAARKKTINVFPGVTNRTGNARISSGPEGPEGPDGPDGPPKDVAVNIPVDPDLFGMSDAIKYQSDRNVTDPTLITDRHKANPTPETLDGNNLGSTTSTTPKPTSSLGTIKRGSTRGSLKSRLSGRSGAAAYSPRIEELAKIQTHALANEQLRVSKRSKKKTHKPTQSCFSVRSVMTTLFFTCLILVGVLSTQNILDHKPPRRQRSAPTPPPSQQVWDPQYNHTTDTPYWHDVNSGRKVLTDPFSEDYEPLPWVTQTEHETESSSTNTNTPHRSSHPSIVTRIKSMVTNKKAMDFIAIK